MRGRWIIVCCAIALALFFARFHPWHGVGPESSAPKQATAVERAALGKPSLPAGTFGRVRPETGTNRTLFVPPKRSPPMWPPASHPRPRSLPDPLPDKLRRYLSRPELGGIEWETFLLNRRLQIRDDLDRCLGGRVNGPGKMSVWMVYRINPPNSSHAEGLSVEPDDSTLSPGDDALVLECLKEDFIGVPFEFPQPRAGDVLHAHAQIILPVDNDPVYRFLQTGSFQ